MRHIIKVILLIINLLFCGLLLIGAYSGFVATRIGVLFELIFPFSLAGCFICFVIWLIYRPKYALLSVVFVALSWGGVTQYTPFHASHPIDNSQPGFTLMTYNAYSYLDFEGLKTKRNRTLDFILWQDADIVCLQEFLPLKANKYLYITQAQVDTLTARYPYRSHNSITGILSKYPIQKIAQISYTPTSSVAIYKINIDGRTITLVNQHLESIGLTKTDKELYQQITENPNTDQLEEIKTHLLGKLSNAAEARNQQADQIAEEIADISGPLIICGDFNDSPLSYSVRRFQRIGFRDAYNELGSGPGITYHANRFWFRIDHILYRGDLEAIGLERPRFRSSDHYPLVTQFNWTNPAYSSTQ